MNVHTTTIAVAVILAIACSIMQGCYQQEETKREAVRSGLVQKQNPGSYHIIWSKPD